MATTAKIKMISPGGQFVDFGLDGLNGEDILAVVIAFESEAVNLGFEPFVMAQAPAAVSNPGPASTPAPVAGEVEVATEDGQPGQLAKRFRSAVIEVQPRPDGKATVAFYGDDIVQPINQYPYVTNTYQPKTWVEKFANICAFTVEDFQKSGKFAVVADVEVRFGKNQTQRGNYYRNISSLTPAPGVAAQEVTTFEVEAPAPTQPSEPEDIPF